MLIYNFLLAEAKLQKKIDFISSLPFFKNIDKKRLILHIERFKAVKFKKNDVIFREGDADTNICMVKKGEVKLYKKTPLPEPLPEELNTASPLAKSRKIRKEIEVHSILA